MFKKDAGALASRRKVKKEEVNDDGTTTPSHDTKQSAALLRIQKDFADLEVPDNVELVKHDELQYSFIIKVNSGYWKGGMYEFQFVFPSQYPFTGMKVTCVDKIYHPNIDLDGGVCVSILRPWKPTYSTQIVLFGLLFLFTHPNPNDPLNQEAAKDMRDTPKQFEQNVKLAMKGSRVNGVLFAKNRGLT